MMYSYFNARDMKMEFISEADAITVGLQVKALYPRLPTETLPIDAFAMTVIDFKPLPQDGRDSIQRSD